VARPRPLHFHPSFCHSPSVPGYAPSPSCHSAAKSLATVGSGTRNPLVTCSSRHAHIPGALRAARRPARRTCPEGRGCHSRRGQCSGTCSAWRRRAGGREGRPALSRASARSPWAHIHGPVRCDRIPCTACDFCLRGREAPDWRERCRDLILGTGLLMIGAFLAPQQLQRILTSSQITRRRARSSSSMRVSADARCSETQRKVSLCSRVSSRSWRAPSEVARVTSARALCDSERRRSVSEASRSRSASTRSCSARARSLSSLRSSSSAL